MAPFSSAIKEISDTYGVNKQDHDKLACFIIYHAFDMHKEKVKSENLHSFLDKKQIKAVHNHVVSSFSCLMLKHLLVTAFFFQEENMDAFILKEFKANGLNFYDYTLFYYNIKYNPKYSKVKEHLLNKIERYRSSIETYGKSTSALKSNCTVMMKTIHKHIHIQVYTKLRFIYKHNHMEPEDFIHGLYSKAIQVFYRSAPFISWKHLENTIKRAVTNYTINIINYYTSKRRTKLTNEEGTFVTTEVSFNDLYRDSDEEKQSLHLQFDCNDSHYIDFSYAPHEYQMIDFKISKDNILKRLDGPTRQVCSTLLLDNDKKFIQFCNAKTPEQEFLSSEDVLEYYQRKYPRLVMDYYGVDKRVMSYAMTTVYSLLKDSKNKQIDFG